MVEVLGHKSLLGLGVVVVWLLLFHLLVNIWLLCIFTSLLVVLGGWLGSQAVLESNSVIHLERFITLGQAPSSVEDEQHLDQEIHNTVRKIIRDFVSSWYSRVSSNRHFETEVQEAMVSMAMELKLRARQVDRKELTERILDLFGSHLQDCIKAKELVKEQQILLTADPKSEREKLLEAYFNITSPHLALMNGSEEINYVRAMVDLLLHILVPTPHLKSRTGRFVVGELITCNVMQPLIDKLSNPDWLNVLITEVLDKSSNPQKTPATEPSSVSPPQAPTSLDQASLPVLTDVSQSIVVTQQPAEAEMISVNKVPMPEVAANDAVDAEEVDFPTNNAEEDETTQPFLRSFTRRRKSNPFYQEYDSDLDSPHAEDKRRSMDSLVIIDQEEILDDKKKQFSTSLEGNIGVDLEVVNASPVDGSCPSVIVNSETVIPPNGCGPTLVSSADAPSVNSTLQDMEKEGGSSALNPNRELVLGGDQTVIGNPNELTVISPLHTCSPLGTFSFEPLSSPEGPVVIQNLRITGTITAKEHRGTGSHPYTLYTIKYETAMGFESQGSSQSSSEDVEVGPTCEKTPSIHPVAYHMVNRRYSEFLNLQTRLEEKGDLRKLIKGVKGPKKVFPEMPFGNMDSDKIEARKGLLETFLKQLCTMPEIANSEEMQEFLALNTDARIAFVKKPFIASRIDKFVVNAIVDTLKTAFPRSEPQSPTEDEVEIDGGKLSVDKKSRSRLRFSSKNMSFMNDAVIRPPVLFSLDQTDMVFKGASLEILQAFINEQEMLSLRAEADSECSTLQRDILSRNKRERHNNEHGSETALAEVVLNILCLLMNEQWSWLCTENIQKTIRLLFGTLINRWLDVSVANLMSARHWAIYLRVIQEAVWPGGSLPKLPRPERSQQQKDSTKQQALHCLMSLLPDLVSDMLGSEKYQISWQIVLDSFQDKRINRHIVYCVFDLLLEVLVPEIPEEAFQRSMLQTFSKNPEKLLA